jgi:hypothetical protein
MALSKKEAGNLILRLHQSNKTYLVKTFSLSDQEAEFLLEAWRIYTKDHPEVLERSPLSFLDCFVHGYLAHVELKRGG